MSDLHPRFFGSFPAIISQNKLKTLDVNPTSKVFELILADKLVKLVTLVKLSKVSKVGKVSKMCPLSKIDKVSKVSKVSKS